MIKKRLMRRCSIIISALKLILLWDGGECPIWWITNVPWDDIISLMILIFLIFFGTKKIRHIFFGTKKFRPMGWTQIILLGSKPKFSGMIDHHPMWWIKFVPWDDKLSSSQFLTVFDENRPMGRKKIVPWPIIPWDDRVKSSHGTKKNRPKKSAKSCPCDVDIRDFFEGILEFGSNGSCWSHCWRGERWAGAWICWGGRTWRDLLAKDVRLRAGFN